ncbi:SET domain-containing protein [Paenibacillus sp. N4]|uniref:SET domain-containing protein n=1 Tax=Paenibacillus vietnamensis TaxID=2590547 RepID=UPI001CD0610A|nr:SET domain-containing protein [Paenibacillus vietnamensis]MCA0755871.1 SET domain-containing protein [Paenibacillus vietnamensis]
MIHPDTELRFVSEQVGLGVFATKFIPKGTIVWISDDLEIVLDEDYVDSLDEMRKNIILKYTYQENNGDYILHWDHTRYMNHSFLPNCIDTAYDFQLAARDIKPGEQLTCDYGILGDVEDFECVPEDGATRTEIKADDYLHYYQEWDEMAREAFKHFNEVEQPLKFLIKKKFMTKVKNVASGRRPLDSILTLFES